MRLTYKAVFFFALAASLLAQQQPGQLKHDGNGALEAFYAQDTRNSADQPRMITLPNGRTGIWDGKQYQEVKPKSHKKLWITLICVGAAAGVGTYYGVHAAHRIEAQVNGLNSGNNGITVIPGTFGGAH